MSGRWLRSLVVVSGIAEVRSSSFTLGFVPADVTLLLFYSLFRAVPSTFHLFHVCVCMEQNQETLKKKVKYLILLSPNYKESFFRGQISPYSDAIFNLSAQFYIFWLVFHIL